MTPSTGQPPMDVTPRPRRLLPPEARHRSRWLIWLIGGCLGVFVLVALACALLVGLFSGLAIRLANQQTVTTSSTQTLTVSGTTTLIIDNSVGSVQVNTGAPGEVTLTTTKTARAESADAARAELKGINVAISQNGDMITVTTSGGHTSPFRSYAVDLLVSVPPTTNLDLSLHMGNVNIAGITGSFNGDVGAGNLTATSVTLAGASQLHVNSGSVILDAAFAPQSSLDLRVSTGNTTITLPHTTATHIEAMTSVGQISLSGLNIASTTNGPSASASGDTQPNPSSQLAIHVGTGNVSISAG